MKYREFLEQNLETCWDIWHCFGFWYHLDLNIVQEPFVLRKKNALIFIWLKVVLSQTIDSSYLHFLFYLYISTKYQCLTYITTMISMGKFFDITIGIAYQYPCIHLYIGPKLVKLWRSYILEFYIPFFNHHVVYIGRVLHVEGWRSYLGSVATLLFALLFCFVFGRGGG